MEKEEFERLRELEKTAMKKSKIYSRLLTDMRLAKEMESMATRHEERADRIEKMAQGVAEK